MHCMQWSLHMHMHAPYLFEVIRHLSTGSAGAFQISLGVPGPADPEQQKQQTGQQQQQRWTDGPHLHRLGELWSTKSPLRLKPSPPCTALPALLTNHSIWSGTCLFICKEPLCVIYMPASVAQKRYPLFCVSASESACGIVACADWSFWSVNNVVEQSQGATRGTKGVVALRRALHVETPGTIKKNKTMLAFYFYRWHLKNTWKYKVSHKKWMYS